MMRNCSQNGVALLAVIWLSLALSMIAFSTAMVVRTNAAVINNQTDSQRAYFMASGAIYRAIYGVSRSVRVAPATQTTRRFEQYQQGARWMRFGYQEGEVVVEVVPENAKLPVNEAQDNLLRSLFEESGLRGNAGAELAEAIVDWRTPRSSSVQSSFDLYYSGLPQPFTGTHTAFADLAELVPIKGMTMDIFYGTTEASGIDSTARHRTIPDLLTTERAQGPVNINYAPAAVLAAQPGWDRALASEVVAERNDEQLIGTPFLNSDDLVRRVPSLARLVGISPFSLTSGNSFTLIATGRVHGSAITRTVRAIVRISPALPNGYRVIGWWDDWPWTPAPKSILESNREAL